MRNMTRHRPVPRIILVWTLLLAVLVSGFFAPGTMAARAADGSLVLELCTPDGPKYITIGQDGNPVEVADPAKVPGSDHLQPVCAWAQAQMAQGWTPATGWALPAPQASMGAQFFALHETGLPKTVTKTSQSQAPPAFT